MLQESKLEVVDLDQIRQIRTPTTLQQAFVDIHQMTLNDPMLWAFAVCRGRRLGYEREEQEMA